ncbi:MAG: hypothetical protein M0Z59_02215 [Nitrospiraceae bacterium]|nr:hypothetical protein [Nitrospiraceae bacterium]
MIRKSVCYFEKPGRENTGHCIEIAREAVKAEGYRHIAVATTGGDTALALGGAFSGLFLSPAPNIVAVTHSAGFREPNALEMSAGTRDRIESMGIRIFTGPMLTHSLETALAQKFSGVYPTLLIAQALRRFGEGTKVACEIVMMAVDAGLVPEDEEVLGIAGTARGADTVLLIKSAASKRFLDLRVLEVLAKPRLG